MTRRIGSKGQVVIPKEMRDRAGLHPGAEVDFELRGDEVTLRRRPRPQPLGGRFKHTGLAQGLLRTERASRGERVPRLVGCPGMDGWRRARLHRHRGTTRQGMVMSWVNAVEVYYRLDRVHGREVADSALADLREVIGLELPGVTRMVEVARLKSARPIALGDCFAIATAAARHLPLLTGDPEILGQADLPCAVEDLRPQPG